MAFFALPEIKSFTVFGLGFILEGIVQLKLREVERKSIGLPLSHCGRNYKFLASQMMDDGQILLHSWRPQLIIRPIHYYHFPSLLIFVGHTFKRVSQYGERLILVNRVCFQLPEWIVDR
jgi:hypothetical protein